MTALAVVLSILALPAAALFSLGISTAAQRLGSPRGSERITRADERWLAQHLPSGRRKQQE